MLVMMESSVSSLDQNYIIGIPGKTQGRRDGGHGASIEETKQGTWWQGKGNRRQLKGTKNKE